MVLSDKTKERYNECTIMDHNQIRFKAARIFLKAAEYIRQYGWQKEGMGVDGKPRCSMGALASAYPRTKWDKSLASLMYKALNKELKGLNLTDFNHKFNDGNKAAQLFEQVATSLSK